MSGCRKGYGFCAMDFGGVWVLTLLLLLMLGKFSFNQLLVDRHMDRGEIGVAFTGEVIVDYLWLWSLHLIAVHSDMLHTGRDLLCFIVRRVSCCE